MDATPQQEIQYLLWQPPRNPCHRCCIRERGLTKVYDARSHLDWFSKNPISHLWTSLDQVYDPIYRGGFQHSKENKLFCKKCAEVYAERCDRRGKYRWISVISRLNDVRIRKSAESPDARKEFKQLVAKPNPVILKQREWFDPK